MPPSTSTTTTTISSTTTTSIRTIESIQVPSDGSIVVSSTTLQSGVTYQLRASGTVVVGNTPTSGPIVGDAEYSIFPSGQVEGACTSVPSIDIGIGVNDTVNDTAKSPDWGTYNPGHVYTVNFTGLGTTITLSYHDCNFVDNSGSLTVQILGP